MKTRLRYFFIVDQDDVDDDDAGHSSSSLPMGDKQVVSNMLSIKEAAFAEFERKFSKAQTQAKGHREHSSENMTHQWECSHCYMWIDKGEAECNHCGAH